MKARLPNKNENEKSWHINVTSSRKKTQKKEKKRKKLRWLNLQTVLKRLSHHNIERLVFDSHRSVILIITKSLLALKLDRLGAYALPPADRRHLTSIRGSERRTEAPVVLPKAKFSCALFLSYKGTLDV